MDNSTLDNTPTNCITQYLNTTLSLPSFPLVHFMAGNYSELHQFDDSDDGSVQDHAFSKPFLAIDVIWNLGFVFVSVFVLLFTFGEKPSSPLRVWVCGYALQCLLHVGLIYYEHQWRNGCGVSVPRGHNPSRFVKRLESANTIASSFWWVFGFYWIVTGGQSLLQDSPRLYWLTVVFLALDVFFMIFCIGMACIICLALFCCIPIVAIAYAMTIREGASEDEIRLLPKYPFHPSYAPMSSGSTNSECCICLTQYTEGSELCTLPCNHHFHYGCISKWLRINATCPLCKFNIKAKGDSLV